MDSSDHLNGRTPSQVQLSLPILPGPATTGSTIQHATDGQLQNSPIHVDEPRVPPFNLWKQAYEQLKAREPSLITGFEGFLQEYYGCHDISPTNNDFATKIVESSMEKNEARDLVLRIGRERISIRKAGENVIRAILWANDFISAAVSSQPYAALAWSGVSILLPLILQPTKQKEALVSGLSSVADVLQIAVVRQDIYFDNASVPPHRNYISATTDLYSCIFEYQIRVVNHMSHKSGKRLIKSVIQADDWPAMVEKTLSANRKCESFMHLTDTQEERAMLAQRSYRQKTSLNVQKQLLVLFEQSQEQQLLERQDEKERALLQELATASDYKTDKNLVSTRIADTCEWFFEDQTFKQWRDCPESSLLWVTAGPGCGKSVLARALIDERRVSSSVMSSTLCYFFFKDSQERRTQSKHALGALLHQLFQASDLIKHGLASHRNHGKSLLQKFDEMWDILLKAANDPDAGEIICVIDALDECEQTSRLQLLDRLITFYSRPDLKTASAVLKFLVTSRPYEDLDDRFQHLRDVTNYVRCDGDEHSPQIAREINIVIDAKIKEIFPNHSQNDQDLIAKRMKSQNNRTYLWLFLTIDIIKSSRSKYRKLSSIQGLMDDLPIQIADAYEKILSQSSDEVVARRLLQIIVAAREPLRLVEANIALTLATQPECQSLKDLDLWPPETFAADIKNICGLLVTCYDDKLVLIHQTAREFLLPPSASAKASQKSWRGSIEATEAEELMAEICTRYLIALDPSRLHILRCGGIFPTETKMKEIRDLEAQFPLLPYSAQHWALHYRNQTHYMGKSHNPSFQRALVLCDAEALYCEPWLLYFRGENVPRNARSSLLLAVHLGLNDMIKANLGHDLDKCTDRLNYHESAYSRNPFQCTQTWGPPLHLASARGRLSTVKTLLDFGADINLEAGRGRPLHIAASMGHQDVVRFLLNNGADVNAMTTWDETGDGEPGCVRTALGTAIDGSHVQTVNELLKHGADINARTSQTDVEPLRAMRPSFIEGAFGEFSKFFNPARKPSEEKLFTPLQLAVLKHKVEITNILLESGADVNARATEESWTALIVAATRGDRGIVKLLLDNKADVELTGGPRSWTPLKYAVTEQKVEIANILIHSGADVNAKSANGLSALHLASNMGQKNIMELLLDAGADINAGGDFMGPPLWLAALQNHPRTVNFLLNHGADPNISLGPSGTLGFPKVFNIRMNHSGATWNDNERELFEPTVDMEDYGAHDLVED